MHTIKGYIHTVHNHDSSHKDRNPLRASQATGEDNAERGEVNLSREGMMDKV